MKDRRALPLFWSLRISVIFFIQAGVFFLVFPGNLSAGESAVDNGKRDAILKFDALQFEGDFPPAGSRSLFDFIVHENGGLPYPFEKLTALIKSYSEGDSSLPTILIPDGRSLVRSASSFSEPRVLLGVDARPRQNAKTLGFLLKNRLFIGYVEKSRQLEIISYNEGAGRFEFQVVEDYNENRQPRILYARRNLCLSCHQNGAPIFSVRPWSETNSNPAVAGRIAMARGSGRENSYHGIPLKGRLKTSESYDALTKSANNLLAAQRIWGAGCGGGRPGSAACRRLLLLLGLQFAWEPSLFNLDESEDYPALLSLFKIFWPSEGIRLPSSELADRDPILEESSLGPTSIASDWIASKFAAVFGGMGAADAVSKKAVRVNFPREADPLTRRPAKRILDSNSGDGVFGVSQFFSRKDIRLIKAASNNNFERVAAIIRDDSLQEYFAGVPLRRSVVMRALLQNLGVKSLPRSCCEVDAGLPEPAGMSVQPLVLADESPMKLFRKYCFACHRGNPARRLDFMSGESERDVWKQMSGIESMADVLDWERYHGANNQDKLMPPIGSYQYQILRRTSGEGRDSIAIMRSALMESTWRTAGREGTVSSIRLSAFIVIAAAMVLSFTLLTAVARRFIYQKRQIHKSRESAVLKLDKALKRENAR